MGSEVEQPQHNPNPTTNTNINKLNEYKTTENNANGNITVTKKTLSLIQPHSLLPKPTPPISNSHPQSTNPNDVVQLNFKTFFRQRSNDLTSAITRTISSIKNSIDDNSFNDQNDDVKEFKLSGLKVVVTVKNDASLGKVRITLFSRSNCRDCSAVRRFFRERGLKFVEINIDVYTEREKELNQRIGNSNSNSTVPMIFFNEKLIGGLVELNAMRTNGELEKKLIEIANGGFSGDVPVAPAYGFDEVAEEKVAVEEEIAKVVRVLRQRLPIQDRLMKMKIVRNCFDGSELVELLVRNHGYVHDKVRLFS
jgi:glutaredoxin